ncbi:MAG TPA: response regulator transcription factor [Myxococcaceae bacterium]|nr:response regulator transcription factor [Myxococcaceae bacterium]
MTTGQRVRISLFEPVRLHRECLQGLLSGAGMDVLGGYPDPVAFLAALPTDRPDVALADLGLNARGPGADVARVDGMVREVRDQYRMLPLVVIAGAGQPDPEACYRDGAAAWFDADHGSTDELLRTLQAAAGGVRLFPSSLTQSSLRPEPRPVAGPAPLLSRLSQRERQVLSLIGAGADNLKIAAQLDISERTVKAHVTGLYRKTQVENRTQLAILAREVGLRPFQDVPVAPDRTLA